MNSFTLISLTTIFTLVSFTLPAQCLGELYATVQDDQGNSVKSGTGYLIKKRAGTLNATQIDSFYDDSFSHFSMFKICSGDYFVKAALNKDDPQYKNFFPTYFGGSLFWATATTINYPAVSDPRIKRPIIKLIKGVNPGGPGFVSGRISAGANKKEDPLPGISIILLNENEEPVAYAISNKDGNYSIDDLPLGKYDVHIDAPNAQNTPISIELTNEELGIENLNFDVSDDVVYTHIIEKAISVTSQVNIFPNPASQQITIIVGDFEEQVHQVVISNLSGEEVLHSSNLSLNVSTLEAGAYITTVKFKSGLNAQKMLIIQ